MTAPTAPRTEHKNSGASCTVAHYDGNGNALPACILCTCGAHVRPSEWDAHAGNKTPVYAPRTEAERAARVREVSNAHMDASSAAYSGAFDLPGGDSLRSALRDAANAYAERVVPPVAPRRVPPNHKGVTYRDGVWQNRGVSFVSASGVIAGDPTGTLTDDDHKHLLALRDAPPSDPAREAVKKLVVEWVGEDYASPTIVDAIVALIDQHAAPELLQERYWCGCVREARWDRCEKHTALDHDDEPPLQNEVSPDLTVEQCVARLVAEGFTKQCVAVLDGDILHTHAGATAETAVGMYTVNGRVQARRVLIAPAPERAP